MAPPRLPEAVVGGDDQPVRVAGLPPGDPVRRGASCSTRATFQVAALGVVDFLPFMIFTLPAGVWVDRLRRRPILIVGDFGRAVLLLSIPIAYVLDVLTLGQLYVVGFLVGTCTVFFDVAYQSYLPSLVERQQIIEGNSKLEISRSAAQIAGPGFAGLLIQAFTAPYAVLLDALSFLGSGLFFFGIRRHEDSPVVQTADGVKTEPVDRAEGGPPVRAGQPESARSGGLHRDLELLLERLVRDHHRVPRARARALRRGDRARLLARELRLAHRGVHRNAHLATVRDRADDDRGGRSSSDRPRSSSRSRPPGTRRSRSSSWHSSCSGSRSSSTTSSR